MAEHLRDVVDLEPFEYRWPETVEKFTRGWKGRACLGSRRFTVVHAVGSREVYARHRIHTVTFVNGQPSVEGVAADDFDRSNALVSLIKIGASHQLAKEPSDVPPEYSDFEIVDHRVQIDAPYSKRCLALKIAVDDVNCWSHHAVHRFIAQGR